MKVFRFQTQLFNALWTLWKRQIDHLQLLCRTLFFNYFTSWSTIIDTGLEPLFWFVDNFVRYLGPIFMVIIAGIVMSVVVTFYVCLLPHKWHQSTGWSIYHLVVGHWFLANTAFHYYKAAFTDPGTPPQQIPEVVSICKKCISPKPPRTHHCSICDRCVLKMDHHCPWLNNCVGHYNHRHFFQFCVFMCIGCFYVSYCAYEVYKEHYYGRNDTEFVGLFSWKWFKRLYYMLADDPPADYVGTELLQYGGIVSPYEEVGGFHAHQWVGYMFMLSTAASAAVGLLTLFHGRLINSAQTSIEIHINRKERKRLKDKGLVFRNPYDFGAWKNWKIFLGLHNGRSVWRHIFLPSGHPPEGNGLQWKTNSYTDPNGLLLL